MRRTRTFFAAICALLTALCISLPLAACGGEGSPSGGGDVESKSFKLVENGNAAVIVVEGTNAPGSTDGDYPAVIRAAHDLGSDIKKIVGVTAPVAQKPIGYSKNAIIIGTVDRSQSIRRIASAGKIDVAELEGKWESYTVKTVSDPFGDGKIETALVVAGSDRRGAVYGTYAISEMLGMTPWSFFADSVPDKRDNLELPADFVLKGEEPQVKYRGIFINDEECLEAWARALDEGKHLGPNFYEKLFEMLLRMHANYLWPGMHGCVDAFSDYPENPINADYYGIVIGTSHCDMLLRNNINEWDSFKSRYEAAHPSEGKIEYDYTVSPEAVREYWRQSVEANKDYEVQWTLGMRGAHDEGLNLRNINQAPWYGDKVMLMEQIFEDQRNILREVLENDTLEDVFMMFIPYKEVQQIYNSGLSVPEDVTIMWADDNHGFIRNLPDEAERERSGGHGIYYHNSYWGPDNESYMWINSMPFTLVYEEMSKAYDFGVRKAWILNSGDTIPNLPEIEFFVDLGYDRDAYDHTNVFEHYVGKMVSREFGEQYCDELIEIYKGYTQLTNSRKLEQMSVDIFGFEYGDEAERRVSEYKALYERGERIYASLPASKRDTFYELLLFELRCAYFTNAEFYYAHKGNLAYEEGRNATAFNCYQLSKEFNHKRKDEISYYDNVLSDGKWKNLMDPENYHSPVMSGFANGSPTFELGAPRAGVYVEGGVGLTFYAVGRESKYIDVFNKGAGSIDVEVSTEDDFIVIGSYERTVFDEQRVWISVDFSKVTASASGTVTVSSGDFTQEITVQAVNDSYDLPQKTYIESDGYACIEAEHFSRERSTDETYWTVIEDLGRVEGAMVRAETETLVGYGEVNYRTSAPYLEYDVYFNTAGTFETEVYRLPTLSSLGRVRFAIGIDDNDPAVLEGENDYGTNNPAWEEGVFTQIIKHKTTLTVAEAGVAKIRLYMLDPYITIDKIVVYTDGKKASYFGPPESYNTTFNTDPSASTGYEPFYETKYTLSDEYDIKSLYGNGYFVEKGGKLSIEAETAALGGVGASTTGWIVAQTDEGISMRTVNERQTYADRLFAAPRMDFEVIISTPGAYNLWVNLNSPMPSSNTYAIAVNGAHKFTQSDFNWSREEVFKWRKADRGTLRFDSAGKYTITVYCVTDGQSIDALYLTTGSEEPDANTFRQSARTPVWTGDASEAAADGARRERLLQALYATKDFENTAAGEGLGEYGEAQKTALRSAVTAAYALLNAPAAISEDDTAASVAALGSALDAFIASRVMSDGDGDYLVYEDYEGVPAGLAPFGFDYYDRNLTPDVTVRGGDDRYLNIRTFNKQNVTERANVKYAFAPASGTITLKARMSFNEAEWGSLYLLGEDGRQAVCIAFEYAYNKYNIVAYDMGVKRIIASYERNKPVELTVTVDIEQNTYSVVIDGETAAEDLAFRNSCPSLSAVMFGSGARNADMRMYALSVSVAKEA